ncbi:hypothetical protein [Profundibacter sp.]
MQDLVSVERSELLTLRDQAIEVSLLLALAQSTVICLSRAAEMNVGKDLPSALELLGRALAGDETIDTVSCRLGDLAGKGSKQ